MPPRTLRASAQASLLIPNTVAHPSGTVLASPPSREPRHLPSQIRAREGTRKNLAGGGGGGLHLRGSSFTGFRQQVHAADRQELEDQEEQHHVLSPMELAIAPPM